MLKTRYLLLIVPLFLTGCSGDASVLYKDLESRVMHTVMGFVLGEPTNAEQSETAEAEQPESDGFEGHAPKVVPTI